MWVRILFLSLEIQFLAKLCVVLPCHDRTLHCRINFIWILAFAGMTGYAKIVRSCHPGSREAIIRDPRIILQGNNVKEVQDYYSRRINYDLLINVIKRGTSKNLPLYLKQFSSRETENQNRVVNVLYPKNINGVKTPDGLFLDPISELPATDKMHRIVIEFYDYLSRHPNWKMRAAVATGLGKHHMKKDALGVLEKLLNDSHYGVVLASVQALENINSGEAVATLKKYVDAVKPGQARRLRRQAKRNKAKAKAIDEHINTNRHAIGKVRSIVTVRRGERGKRVKKTRGRHRVGGQNQTKKNTVSARELIQKVRQFRGRKTKIKRDVRQEGVYGKKERVANVAKRALERMKYGVNSSLKASRILPTLQHLERKGLIKKMCHQRSRETKLLIDKTVYNHLPHLRNDHLCFYHGNRVVPNYSVYINGVKKFEVAVSRRRALETMRRKTSFLYQLFVRKIFPTRIEEVGDVKVGEMYWGATEPSDPKFTRPMFVIDAFNNKRGVGVLVAPTTSNVTQGSGSRNEIITVNEVQSNVQLFRARVVDKGALYNKHGVLEGEPLVAVMKKAKGCHHIALNRWMSLYRPRALKFRSKRATGGFRSHYKNRDEVVGYYSKTNFFSSNQQQLRKQNKRSEKKSVGGRRHPMPTLYDCIKHALKRG